VEKVLEGNIGGSPQQPDLQWTHLKPERVSSILEEQGNDVSSYIVGQIYEKLNLRQRQLYKGETMGEVVNRDEQFLNIKRLKEAFLAAGFPVFSVDTKKKEPIGNFYRSGYGYGTEAKRVNDHDFLPPGTTVIIPHGIYDVADNWGYMTLGVSKDTAAFVADNIGYWWEEKLQFKYPDKDMMLLLMDGGGSNNCRHFVVKNNLIQLAQDLDMRIVIAHYPAYCSKWNPIEHRLFSQIHHAIQGEAFTSIPVLQNLIQQTSTKTGLGVDVRINPIQYQSGTRADCDIKAKCFKHIEFDEKIPLWNYVIFP
jgi:Rhodopirellula transposase DDE domain